MKQTSRAPENTKPGNKKNNSLLFSITGRSALFLVLELFALVLLYVSGNFQFFLDSTQKFILLVCALCSMLLVLLSTAGIIESVVLFIISKQKKYWIFFALYILCFIVTAVILVLFRVLTFISSGL